MQNLNKMSKGEKIFYAFIIGVFLYWIIFKKLGATITEENTNISGATLPSGTSQQIELYEAKYFKDSEYFKDYSIPAQYYPNWVKLVKVLDKIRIAFGSAVLIKLGYLPHDGKSAITLQNQCRFVVITAQNKDNTFLYGQAMTLKIGKGIDVQLIQQMTDGSILITI